MSYNYTLVPSELTPNRAYAMDTGAWLLPAEGRQVRDTRHLLDGEVSTTHVDHLSFVTETDSIQEHMSRLKYWLPFHAFLTRDSSGIVDVEQQAGRSTHSTAATLDDISANTSTLRRQTDFDHFGRSVYPAAKEDAPDISYKDMFGVYRELDGKQRGVVINWSLDFVGRPNSNVLTVVDSSYWQIAKDVSVIEYILGKPPTCTGPNARCGVCGRKWPDHDNLGKDNKNKDEWRLQQLRKIIGNEDLAQRYTAIVNTAYNLFRHPTTHSAEPPTAEWVWQGAWEVTWDLERSLGAYKENADALFSIVHAVRQVARYLLLNKLFGVRCFPRPPVLTVEVSVHSDGQALLPGVTL